MKKLSVLLLPLFVLTLNSYSQNIDSLRLSSKEIPEGYSLSKEDQCISIQACTFYDSPDIYEMLIGKIKRKDIQNFTSKRDNGSIMYFEFDGDFQGEGFLGGLLWGGSKRTKEHPETYLAKKNILIIWSFNKGSAIQKISEDKIKKLLK